MGLKLYTAFFITFCLLVTIVAAVLYLRKRRRRAQLDMKIAALREARAERDAITSRIPGKPAHTITRTVRIPGKIPTIAEAKRDYDRARPSYVEPEHVSMYVGAEAFAPIPSPDPTPSYNYAPTYDHSSSSDFGGGYSDGGGAGSDF